MNDRRLYNVPLFDPQDVPQLGPVDVPWTFQFWTFDHLSFLYNTEVDV